MDCRYDLWRTVERHKLPALLRHAKSAAQQRLRCGCAEAYHHLRLHKFYLDIQPRTAGGDLERVWLLVNAALAARLPLEMLHGIGDVGLLVVNASVHESFVEDCAGRPDKGLTRKIF